MAVKFHGMAFGNLPELAPGIFIFSGDARQLENLVARQPDLG